MKVSSLVTLCLLGGLGACSVTEPRLVQVDPEIVRLRNAEQVNIRFESWTGREQVSLMPGGPYERAAAPGRVLAQHMDEDGVAWSVDSAGLWRLDVDGGAIRRELHLAWSAPASAARFSFAGLWLHQGQELVRYSRTASGWQREVSLPSIGALRQWSVGRDEVCLLDEDGALIHAVLNQDRVQQRRGRIPSTLQLKAAGEGCWLSEDGRIEHWQRSRDGLRLAAQFQTSFPVRNVVLQGSLVIVAQAEGGFTLLEHNDGSLVWRGSFNRLGVVETLAVDGDRLLLADQGGVLSLFDISRHHTPRLLSDYRLPARALSLDLRAGQALAATADEHLRWLDFRIESSPLLSTLGTNLGGSRRGQRVGNYLYVADWFSGLHIYDVSLPHNPRLAGSFHTTGSPKGVWVEDEVAYVADDDQGLQVVDVSDPTRPRLITHLPLPGLAYTMKKVGGILYLASHRGGLHILDVRDPAKPVVLSRFETPGKVWAVDVFDHYAYLADDNNGVLVLDVFDPRRPRLLHHFNPGGQAEDIVIRHGLAYVAFFDNGLFVLDLSQPAKPRQLAHLATPGNARGIDIVADTLYLASWRAGVWFYDLTHPAAPRELGYYDTPGAAWGTVVADDVVYALDWWGGLQVLRREGRRLSELGHYHQGGRLRDVTSYRYFLLAAAGGRGLQVFDGRNPLNVVWARGVDLAGQALRVVSHGEYAYVAAAEGGLAVVDLADPFHARLIGQKRFGADVLDLALAGDRLLLRLADGALVLLDMTTPAVPKVLAQRNLSVRALTVHEDQVWLLRGGGELQLWSVKDSTLIFLGVNLPVSQGAKELAVSEDGLFLLGEDHLDYYARGENQWHKWDSLSLAPGLAALAVREDRLFVSRSGEGLYQIQRRGRRLFNEAFYPSVHRLGRMALGRDAIFLAGEKVIVSGQLLPTVPLSVDASGVSLQVPANMPRGAYDLWLDGGQGKGKRFPNVFKVDFPRKKKAKFTLEDLKRIMEQKSFEGKAPSK